MGVADLYEFTLPLHHRFTDTFLLPDSVTPIYATPIWLLPKEMEEKSEKATRVKGKAEDLHKSNKDVVCIYIYIYINLFVLYIDYIYIYTHTSNKDFAPSIETPASGEGTVSEAELKGLTAQVAKIKLCILTQL